MKACYNEATTLQNSDLEKDIVLAEKAGFEYIELWIVQIEKYLETHSSEEMVKLFEGRRIKPFAIDSFEDILLMMNMKSLKKNSSESVNTARYLMSIILLWYQQ